MTDETVKQTQQALQLKYEWLKKEDLKRIGKQTIRSLINTLALAAAGYGLLWLDLWVQKIALYDIGIAFFASGVIGVAGTLIYYAVSRVRMQAHFQREYRNELEHLQKSNSRRQF